MYFFAYVILYRKYNNVEMFVSCSLFNLFILLIVMALIRTDFNIAIGFGLFALLSLIQVRSAQFTKTETAYLFGSVTLGVINGAGISDLTFILISNTVVVLGAWFIGTWSLEHSANLISVDHIRKMSVSLDHIEEDAVGNRELMTQRLSKKIGTAIESFEIKKIDYVRDIVEVTVIYALPANEKAQYSDNVGLASSLSDDLDLGSQS